MHDYLRHHASQKESEKAHSEPEICPVVSVFHNLQRISFEIDHPVEVHLMEGFHRNLAFPMVFGSVTLLVELEVMLHRSTRVSSFLVLSWGYG